MPPERECPFCGSTMRLHERETRHHVPGTSEVSVQKAMEWVCPDCDYFEEAEQETGSR